MSDTPRDRFSEYSYRDELIDDVRTLHMVVAAGSAAQPLELDSLTIQDLEDVMAQMEAAFNRYILRRVQRRTAASPTPRWTFDQALRSPFSGQDIGERSG